MEIDVLGYIDQFANTLRTGEDSCACEEALAILVRWQFDEMLDTASRTAARDLVIEYGGRHAETLAEAHLPWRLPAR